MDNGLIMVIKYFFVILLLLYQSNYSIIRVTLNTESDTVCLFPMASKLAGSNVTNDPLPKRWDPWGGLYVVSSLIKVSK